MKGDKLRMIFFKGNSGEIMKTIFTIKKFDESEGKLVLAEKRGKMAGNQITLSRKGDA